MMPSTWISPAQAQAIAHVDHFKNSEYRSLDVNILLDYYMRCFVEPLARLVGEPRSVANIGTGYGWLAIAFALRTDAVVVAVDHDAARLAAAQRISEIIGVKNKIQWMVGDIGCIPLPSRSVDAAYCVEVIEHTGVNRQYLRDLARITNDVLVITTPNKAFPIIKHDTALPFCHWLPLNIRNVYVSLFGRQSLQHNNQFWSPVGLLWALHNFDRVSRFLQFTSYAEYCATKNLAANARPSLSVRCQEMYFFLVSKLGKWAVFLLPNLASMCRRKAATSR